LTVVDTAEDAWRLYQDAQRVPQTETRAEVLKFFNIRIDEVMSVPCSPSATFYHAFEDYIPRVLKVPQDYSKVTNECALFTEIGKDASDLSLALVPVYSLKLKGVGDEEMARTSKVGSAVKVFNQGIIMPSYSCSLEEIPRPISEDYAVTLLNRLAPAIDFIHVKKWLHGDIKPSNIFIDSLGKSWLGDYGSSKPYEALHLYYGGGTIEYQCEGVDFQSHPRLHDNLGLVISLLDKLGFLTIVQGKSHSLAEIMRQIEVTGPLLKEPLLGLTRVVG
jgi:hypothetical protein